MGSNNQKSATLGMPHGTANNRLRKNLLFKYITQAGDNFCFKCGTKIEAVDDLSVEHKEPWEGRSADLFWDLDNIAFSHLTCNRPHNRGGEKLRKVGPPDTSWCITCQAFKPNEDFWKSNRTWSGFEKYCKQHHNEKRERRRQNRREQHLPIQ
jgi:hypothetical protein